MSNSEKEVQLESLSVNPFKCWSDWHDSDGKAVVTFETMTHNLWNSWESQCISIKGDPELVETSDGNYRLEGETEQELRPEKFDADRFRKPGVYRDSVHRDDERVDEAYTVIVSKNFLAPELCRKYIEKLNEEFERNFSLNIKDEQRPPVSELKVLKHSIEREYDEKIVEKFEGLIQDLEAENSDK